MSRDTELKKWLGRIQHVALDMDGTIYLGGELFAETLPFLETLRELDISWTFLTNNSSKGTDEYRHHLAKFGIQAAPDEIFTSTHAAIALLQSTAPAVQNLFVVGTPGFRNELEAAGFELVTGDDTPQGVIIGFDTALDYQNLCKAAFWVARGLPYWATHPDRVCPTDLPTILLDCGAVCAAIESATSRKPDAIAGKPEPAMLEALSHRFGLQNDEIAMIGDRIYTDVAMAKRAGALGILTLTGEAQRKDLEGSEVTPDLVVEHLGEFAALLRAARETN
jgi:NagD protein